MSIKYDHEARSRARRRPTACSRLGLVWHRLHMHRLREELLQRLYHAGLENGADGPDLNCRVTAWIPLMGTPRIQMFMKFPSNLIEIYVFRYSILMVILHAGYNTFLIHKKNKIHLLSIFLYIASA